MLVDAIQDRSTPEWLREQSVRELEKVAKRDFGYLGRHGVQLPRARREAAVSGITQWWETNRTRYEVQDCISRASRCARDSEESG